jgi:hypothetical protein
MTSPSTSERTGGLQRRCSEFALEKHGNCSCAVCVWLCVLVLVSVVVCVVGSAW